MPVKMISNIIKYTINSYRIRNTPADPIPDYNEAAQTYDEYYGRFLGRKTLEFLDRIPVRTSGRYLDLCCGTGILSIPLAKKAGPGGQVTAVDMSPGMLEKSRHYAAREGLENISFVTSDAAEYLATLPAESFDGVVCAWGICYMDFEKFAGLIHHVLKPGGTVALIENKKDTLKDVSKAYTRIMINYPNAIRKKISINLPSSSRTLTRLLRKVDFSVLGSGDGSVEIPCRNGGEVIKYVTCSGAGSGFMNAVDEKLFSSLQEKVIEHLDNRYRRNDTPRITHEFGWVLGIKGDR